MFGKAPWERTVAVAAAVAVTTSLGIADARGESTTGELSADDRAFIEEFLGADFLGAPVEAPVVADPQRFLGLGDGATWEFLGVHGEHNGQRQTVDFKRVGEEGGAAVWRVDFDGEDGRKVLVDEKGSLLSQTVEDTGDGVVIHTEPPDPVLISGMRGGDEVSYRIDIKMYDAGSEGGTPKYEGYLDMKHQYVGAYRVTVPAGTFEAAAFRWHFAGKVGPASLNDLQFAFYAEGVGPVAIIERKDVSAFVVYQKTNRDARVLARWR